MLHPSSKVSQQPSGLTIHPSLSLFDSDSTSSSPLSATSAPVSTSSATSPKAVSAPSPVGSPTSTSLPRPSPQPRTGLSSSSPLTQASLKARDDGRSANRDVKDIENGNQDYMNLGRMQTGDRDGRGYFSGDMDEWDDSSSEVTEIGKKKKEREGEQDEPEEDIMGDYEEGATPTLETFKEVLKVT